MLASLALVSACAADDPAGPAAGTLAYFSGAGEVEVIDFGSGHTATFDVPSGEPRGLSLSLDGASVAFIVRTDLRRHVYRGDVTSGDLEEISPPARGDSLVWGEGFFHYRVRVDGRDGDALVLDGENEARVVGENTVLAAGAPVIAYVSEGRVFVESVPAGERTEVAQGEWVRPVLLTKDGETVLISQPDPEQDGDTRLVRIDVDGGAETDLGLYGNTYTGHGMSQLSPDESEVIVDRFDEIVAVRMDGGGERVIWRGSGSLTGGRDAGFTASGDVVYFYEENLTPGSDTPEVLDHLWVERSGESVALLEGASACNAPAASSTGALVAWPCDDATHVFSVADGSEILEIPGRSEVLDFDRLDEGLVIAPWSTDAVELRWVDLSGSQASIASAEGAIYSTVAFRP